MDDFSKFQPHENAADENVITFGLYLCVNFMLFSGTFTNAFVFSFKFCFFFIKIALFSWYVIRLQLHINKSKIYQYTCN